MKDLILRSERQRASRRMAACEELFSNLLVASKQYVMPVPETGIQGPESTGAVALDCRVRPGNDGMGFTARGRRW